MDSVSRFLRSLRIGRSSMPRFQAFFEVVAPKFPHSAGESLPSGKLLRTRRCCVYETKNKRCQM